jgi:hypothetical protein
VSGAGDGVGEAVVGEGEAIGETLEGVDEAVGETSELEVGAVEVSAAGGPA